MGSEMCIRDSISDQSYSSKSQLEDELTSKDGRQFTKDEADYAMKHLKTDFKKNALKNAQRYMQDSIESKSELYNKLVEYDDFTEDEAKYAADNVKVDYKENALERAKSLSKDGDTSKSDIKDMLSSKDGFKFTEEEAQYAVDHLK